MNEDKFLEMLFDPERWEAAINKGLDKDIEERHLMAMARKEVRADLYTAMKEGRYRVSPPHTARIPKDNGEYRTVYVNEPLDRVLLGMMNDILFELTKDLMVHPACKSYLKGTGCGKVVKGIVERIKESGEGVVGWKADFSKYFDTVPVRYIDEAFDSAERIIGPSAVWRVLRDYYHSDVYFDLEGEVCESYQSLKQGCAVASWLANVVMHGLDEKLSRLNGDYVRYSDDTLFVGPDFRVAMELMEGHMASMGMTLNPNKVEWLDARRWFKFLGFSIRGEAISLSRSRIKTFQKEIMERTVKDRTQTMERAVNRVNRYLYKGSDRNPFSWAAQVLPVINSEHDVLELDKFVLDCLRAVKTRKRRVGGLGYDREGKTGCIQRGTGRNVTANRIKVPGDVEGYLTLGCMRKAMLTSVELYKTLAERL